MEVGRGCVETERWRIEGGEQVFITFRAPCLANVENFPPAPNRGNNVQVKTRRGRQHWVSAWLLDHGVNGEQTEVIRFGTRRSPLANTENSIVG